MSGRGNSIFASKYPPLSQSFVSKRKPLASNADTKPLPLAESGKVHFAVFRGRCIEVLDPFSIHYLHLNGCFGTGSKSKSTPWCIKKKDYAPEETLRLLPEEAFFLTFFLKCLQIQRRDGSVMTPIECLEAFTQIHPRFISSLVAYVYLKSKNWVVKPGIKLGADFRE